MVVLLPSMGLWAQNYSDGIDNLMEVKYVCEDLARAIRLEWDHSSPQFMEAKKRYVVTQRTVEKMIDVFDSKIRSGEKITKDEINRYVEQATKNSEFLVAYYNENSVAGGTNSLFGLKDIITDIGEIFNGVVKIIDSFREYQIQRRLEKMHEALDGCKLRDGEKI